MRWILYQHARIAVSDEGKGPCSFSLKFMRFAGSEIEWRVSLILDLSNRALNNPAQVPTIVWGSDDFVTYFVEYPPPDKLSV